MSSPLSSAAAELADIAPLVRRAVTLDPRSVVRLRLQVDSVACFVRLPFGVLVGRTVPARAMLAEADRAVAAAELLAWLDGAMDDPPPPRDGQWQGTLPPRGGWSRVETIPDAVVRDLVRKGASALQDAAEREGAPGAQPRAEVADALLDSVVITARSGDLRAEITLRTLGAVTRMGFVSGGSKVAIDVAGRWLRVAAEYGSAYVERPGSGLTLL